MSKTVTSTIDCIALAVAPQASDASKAAAAVVLSSLWNYTREDEAGTVGFLRP